MGQVLQDLSAWALEHNGDTLTITAWHALGLLDDLEARKSKVLLLGLCRTQVHDNPRLYYNLKEACVVPVADLKRIFKHRSQHPGRLLRQNEQVRLKDGAIGVMLVMSVEQTADDTRTVVEAVGQISTMTFQPLGVFDVHLESVRRLHGGVVSETMWKACLANSLKGGRFFPMFVPYQPEQ
ncbi:hypothetical protein C8R43DRAFT_556971 [Mycena crocata]|nr:hypothetical protein C8R43DRAFT_556971 [Mycena crocata]